MSGATPKKFIGNPANCFLCSREVLKKDKLYIFGRSSVDLRGLVNLALGINLSNDSENLDLFVCKKGCYDKLLKLDRALNKVKEIKRDLYTQFRENDQRESRFKRLRPPGESQSCLESSDTVRETGRVTKSLRFAAVSDTTSCTPIADNQPTSLPSSNLQTPDSTLFIRPVDDESIPPPLPTFSPVKDRTNKSTEVEITIKYPSRTVRKVLDQRYESLAKALFYGQPSRIATAVMKCTQVCKFVVSKVFDTLAKEVSGLCSRKNPSILRKTNKNDLVNFKLESLGEEWKKRAPLFYSFLLTSSVTKRKASSTLWLPSMSLAGSILLKQRNGQMNATASVMGVLMKMGSKEVCCKLCVLISGNTL